MPRPRWPAWSTTSRTGTCAAAGAASGAPIPTPRPGTRWRRRPHCTRSSPASRSCLAPFCPFVADAMWRALSGVDETQSVHLADWPVPDGSAIDRDLEAQMELARRLTSLGRAARSEAGVKVRQPLSRALVFLPSDAPAILYDMVAEELNVDEIDVADELSEVLEFELVVELPHPGTAPRRAGEGGQAGAGRARRSGSGGGARSRNVDHAHALRRAGRARSRRCAAPRAWATGLRRLPGRGRGRRARSHARRVAAAPRSGPRSRPSPPGPAQEQRAGRLGSHPSAPRGAGHDRGVLRLHRARGAGRLHHEGSRRGRGNRARPRDRRGSASGARLVAQGARAGGSSPPPAVPEGSAARLRGVSSTPRVSAARSVSSRGAIRWRSIPSMCSPMARPNVDSPAGRQHDVDAAAIRGAVLAGDQSGLDHTVHQPGHAARW